MSLSQVPSEILRLIAVNLGPDDLFHLAISSPQFQHILYDAVICRKVLEVRLSPQLCIYSYSPGNANSARFFQKSIKFSSGYMQEAERETGKYDKALRRLIKRREALQMARPFHVLEVSSEALQFTYTNGALCYTTRQLSPVYKHRLRILTLEGPSVEEVSIDIPNLIKDCDIPNLEENLPYQFRPLYYADGIVSCLYEQKKPHTSIRWLIIYSLKQGGILNARSLLSTANIFVRNNGQYLYFGTKSYPSQGRRRWVLQGFSLIDSTWSSHRTILWDLAGAEMGSTICFEIFGNHLYGVSSQELAGVEEYEWDSPGHPIDSFYYAFRLPLSDSSKVQVLPRSALWRRGATDGPIDDRWNHLQLGQDEKSGRVSIFETRREWLSSWSRRTCYRKQLFWPSTPESTDRHPDERHEDECRESWGSMTHDDSTPENSIHRGDTGFSSSTFDFCNTPVRSYNPSCQAFVDIVSTTTAASPTAKRLRLRVRRRPQEPCPTSESGHMPSSPTERADVANDSADQYVRLWPADNGEREQGGEQPNQSLDHYIDEILNRQAHFDEVDWAMDERVVVFSPKSLNCLDEPRSIMLISFDPGLNFQNLCRWVGRSTPPVSTSHQLNKVGKAPPCGSSTTMNGEMAAPHSSKILGLDFTREPRQTARSTSTPKASLNGVPTSKKRRLEGAFIPTNTTRIHCG
ncbi:uncharacterized protein Triagg1_9575 [Trichoderma aggressivum f. europaeum]|uniref:F-box domain-containing protein n=1 Tax=Trichoderma aggressivum f. europaeum TaxID=173218 RepID=A0AAE1LX12_9HYPO|nr:hypothetical protein Triagg1_9575 [Trichoderma aggressivum f. europaeum]